jgi:hypothetical protein
MLISCPFECFLLQKMVRKANQTTFLNRLLETADQAARIPNPVSKSAVSVETGDPLPLF